MSSKTIGTRHLGQYKAVIANAPSNHVSLCQRASASVDNDTCESYRRYCYNAIFSRVYCVTLYGMIYVGLNIVISRSRAGSSLPPRTHLPVQDLETDMSIVIVCRKAVYAALLTELPSFVTRQHSDSRYLYGISVRPSVCLSSRFGIVPERLYIIIYISSNFFYHHSVFFCPNSVTNFRR